MAPIFWTPFHEAASPCHPQFERFRLISKAKVTIVVTTYAYDELRRFYEGVQIDNNLIHEPAGFRGSLKGRVFAG